MHTADFRCVSISWKLVVLFLNLNLGLSKIWPKRPSFYLPTRDECAHSPVILIKVFDLCRSQDSETTILSHGCCCDFGFSTTLKMPLPPFKRVCLTWCWTEPTQPRPVENWERRPLKLWRALQVRPQTLMTPPPTCGRIDLLGPDLGVFRQAVKDEEQQMLQAAAGADELRAGNDMMQIIHEWWWMNFEKYTHVTYRICFKINDKLYTYSKIDNVCWWGLYQLGSFGLP